MIETLLAIIMLHAECGFTVSVYRICTVVFDSNPMGHGYIAFTAEEGMAISWMSFRSLADMLLGIRFFISVVRKTHVQKYINWISYGIAAMFLDCLFAVILFQHEKYASLEFFFITADAFVKICIILIMHNLRKNSLRVPVAKLEKTPLLKTPLLA